MRTWAALTPARMASRSDEIVVVRSLAVSASARRYTGSRATVASGIRRALTASVPGAVRPAAGGSPGPGGRRIGSRAGYA